MGNINEDLTCPKLMEKVCNSHSLYDPFARIHPMESSTSSYKWGSKRLDYILLSTNAPVPHRIGYQPYDLFHNSDHQSIFMDIDLDYSQMDEIQKPEHRTISSRSREIEKFITIIHRHCLRNNIFKQLEQYSTQDKGTTIGLGNKIDRQLTIGITKALKACSKTTYYPWSTKLHEASLRVKFWKIALTIPSSKLTPALEIIRTTINDVPPLLPARTVRKKRLKNAMIQLRKIRKDSASHQKTFLHNLKQTIVT